MGTRTGDAAGVGAHFIAASNPTVKDAIRESRIASGKEESEIKA